MAADFDTDQPLRDTIFQRIRAEFDATVSAHRAGDRDERSRRGIHLTINGVAAGLRSSG